ncbi:MAG: tetratricopeptide repeat protein [Planctomycetota bacterium]|nr:tetratricopeptide repeat protein [Planctomycetota bacterium]
MHCAPCVRLVPCPRAVGTALLAVVVCVLLGTTAREAVARGGGAAPMNARELARVVEREMKAQDRQVRSATAQGRSLEGLIRRTKQRALDEDSAIGLFLLGRVYGIDKQYDLALQQLRAASQKQAGFHQALYREAAIHLMKKDRVRAEPVLDQALAIAPKNVTYLLTKAVEILAPRNDIAGVKKIAEDVLRIDGENDAARELLARAYITEKDYPRAQRALASLIRKNPKAIPLRVQWVECALMQQRWDEAIGELKNLLAVVPKDPMLQQMLLQAHMGKGDADAAQAQLEGMVKEEPKNWRARRALAEILFSKQDFSGARRECELVLRDLPASVPDGQQAAALQAVRGATTGLLMFCLEAQARALREKDDETSRTRVKSLEEQVVKLARTVDGDAPLPPHMLDLLQVTLARLGRHKERIPYLQRMLAPLKGQPEEEKRLRDLIELIEKGGSEDPGASDGARMLAQLIRRCTNEDPVVRRAALHEYYELNLPFVDPVIYTRHDHRIEPDALCRLWVVKILGRFESGTADPKIVRIAARYVALALEDPASMVRRESAQALGQIGTPAGILYILPHLAAMPLEAPPKTESGREELEREYNATRNALTKLTGRVDYEIGDESWVKLKDAQANRTGWRTWFDTAEGATKRLDGLEDLAAVQDVDPRWQLRYILVDVIAVEPPAPTAVALKAYQVLRDRVRGLSAEQKQGDPWWSTFPLHPDAEVTEANLPKLRSDLKGWWNTARKVGK